MATIHHATVKSAAGKGVILTLEDDTVTAHRPEPNRRVSLDIEDYEGEEPTQQEATERAKDAWVALDNILAFEADHATIRIAQEDGDFVGYALAKGKRGDEIARDPDLDDLFESLNEAQAESGVEDEEEEDRGSVVPAKYKKLYAERGDPNNCGDWLATTLASLCRVLDEHGKETTDLDRLETIAAANDVEPARYGKLGIATNGWQGRYRMTVRNMLTPRVASRGFLFVPEGCGVDHDQELEAPRQWVIEHSPKPKAKADPKAGTTRNPGAGKATAKTRTKKGTDGVAAATAAVKASKAREAARRAGK